MAQSFLEDLFSLQDQVALNGYPFFQRLLGVVMVRIEVVWGCPGAIDGFKVDGSIGG